MVQILNADWLNPLHVEAIVRLLNEYALDEMGGGCELSDFVKANLAAELEKRAGCHVILAFEGDLAVGLAICFEGFSTFACKPLLSIHDIVVSKRHRGRGIAKRLLAQAEAIAIRLGCCKLTLEVLQGNTVAQSVYRSCGYSGYQLSDHAGQALFWQKKLNPLIND
jgi:ribosomal protein S18 acetylase RimI-like enzyme